MMDRTEALARRVRDALGKHNDEDKPVTECVRDLVALVDSLDANVCTWERTMMDAVGEDGPASVAAAVADLKRRADKPEEKPVTWKEYDRARYQAFIQAGGTPDDQSSYFDFIRAADKAFSQSVTNKSKVGACKYSALTAFIEKAVAEGRATQIGGRWLVGDL